MEKHNNFVVNHIKMPLYLTELLQRNEDIVLVHCKKKKNEELHVSCVESLDSSVNSTLNLTGCPLEVDLNVLPSALDFYNKRNCEKTHYIPMKLKSARNFINDYNKNSEETKSIYCVCDGTDAKQTVMLGSCRTSSNVERIVVFARGCVDESHPEKSIESMVEEHIKNVGANSPKIETKVTCVYELYGYKLNSKCDIIDDLENTGSVLVESSWNSQEYDIPQSGATIKMMLQVIVGHQNSVMFPLFQELIFLQHCLSILSNKQGHLDESSISVNPIDVADLNHKISYILQEVNVIRKPSIIPNNLQVAVESIEETSFIDKLWNILKHCSNVGDLKICLSHLFELITDKSLKVQIFEDDKNSVIGRMINDIYAGRMIIPYLSSKQSLELLLELGIQKLKKNYFTIIKSCDFTTGEQLQQNWNEIRSSLTESRRGTLAELNLSQSLSQMRILLHIHVLLEFLQLVEQNCCFPKDVSLSVIQYAYNKYVTENSAAVPFSILESKQLYDLVVPIPFIDVKLTQDFSPIKWQIKMLTSEKNSSVATIFHYSKTPIFPDTVYQYKDADGGSLNDKFVVTCLQSYTDKIC